ncbi:ABC transporter ATP-binding protein [Polycladidibacter hongkongensis]|uniref:ABC transporter ATP-binding protein n=1 Tax=Polycladidibacter hongkongensis TaxID=1647556 RepID=UPI00082ED2F8|nr:ABC transporter ATP-binding protein [Pseudovibrio hongkongensis]
MNSIEIRDLALRFGQTTVLNNLDLDIGEGEFLVLLGSSGCGKSTLLNCIAGLLDISEGQIFINNKNVTWEEPKDRGIGMVFQSYALYPQMTVYGNLAFGLKNAGIPKEEIEKRIAKAADMLQIEPFLQRKPAALSGGQRQRVAIGRALVRDVDVFLFDEPLSNLDAKLRTELRVEIKQLHQRLGNTMIYVTHDQIEAMTLADRIAIMKGGKIQQLDTPANIYNRPQNKYVAGFIGSPSMNFIKGTVSEGKPPVFRSGEVEIPLSGYEFASQPIGETPVWFGIRPEHVVHGDAAADAPFKTTVKVDVFEPMGSDTQVWSKIADQTFRFRIDGRVQIANGDVIEVGFDPHCASLFNLESELRL